MRFLGRAVFTTLLLGLALWQGNSLWQRLSQSWQQLTSAHVEQLKAARARLTYRLDHTSWTLFAIPTGTTSLRVSTNANLPTALTVDPEAVWHYAVAYELLDAQNRMQTRQVYHHRSRMIPRTGQGPDEVSPAAFYLDAPLKPADTRNLVIDLTSVPSATRIRFQLALAHEPVREVAMSLYARTPVSERKVGYAWRRLPQEQKQSLAKGLVYSTDFLKQPEKNQLLQNRWLPLGPKGIAGRDYQSRKLYIRNNIEPPPPSEPTLPRGLIVDAGHEGVLPIPVGGMALRLHFLLLSAAHPPPDQHGIHVTWYGDNPQEQSHHHVTWQDEHTRFEHEFAPGLLVLKVSEGATVVQAFRRDAGEYTPWLIEPRLSRMYLVQPEQPIVFAIVHAKRMSTPFRIDVRHLPPLSNPDNTPTPTVAYELLTAQGQVVQSGHLTSAAAVSRYDRIPSLGLNAGVSDPSTSFFAIPPHVARLRFSLSHPAPETPMLLAAWNRPPDLIRELYKGQEHHAEFDEQRQWAWFPKRPEHAQRLIAEQRSYLLHVQSRPPLEAVDLQAEDYQVEQYRPEGRWRGRYLFLPRAPHAPLRPQALAVTYQPLPTGREQQLVLGGLPQLRFLQPKLMYFSKAAHPRTVQVHIDGVQHHQGTITGRQGEFALPVVSAGAHRIQIHSSPDTRWYMSHVASGGPSHVKRLAYRFGANGLRFIHERQHVTEETLSMRWHAPYGARQATRIHVHLALSPTARRTPSPHWTFNERRYVLEPPPGPPVPVLNTDDAYVDGGQPFFLPIGSDVPAGRYHIRLRLEQGPPGYITLTKLNRGVFESRHFTGEKVPQYVQTHP